MVLYFRGAGSVFKVGSKLPEVPFWDGGRGRLEEKWGSSLAHDLPSRRGFCENDSLARVPVTSTKTRVLGRFRAVCNARHGENKREEKRAWIVLLAGPTWRYPTSSPFRGNLKAASTSSWFVTQQPWPHRRCTARPLSRGAVRCGAGGLVSKPGVVGQRKLRRRARFWMKDARKIREWASVVLGGFATGHEASETL